VVVAGGGTGGGITALIAGNIDLAVCARRPRERELAALKQQEIKVRTVEIAREALAVIVHQDNPIASLSKAQLSAIFGAGGGLLEWPQLGVELQTGGDNAIATRSYQSNSGSYETFRRDVLGSGERYRSDTLCLSGSKDLVTAVANTPNAIGYVLAAYAENAAGVRVVPIAATADVSAPPSPPRLPDHADYPLTRSYFLLMRTDASAHARAMLDWVRSPAGQKITRAAGYEPLGLDR
jgi:phosphate transport system substrate-binding protein